MTPVSHNTISKYVADNSLQAAAELEQEAEQLRARLVWCEREAMRLRFLHAVSEAASTRPAVKLLDGGRAS